MSKIDAEKVQNYFNRARELASDMEMTLDEVLVSSMWLTTDCFRQIRPTTAIPMKIVEHIGNIMMNAQDVMIEQGLITAAEERLVLKGDNSLEH